MSDRINASAGIEGLIRHGDARDDTRSWLTGEIQYADQYGLSSEDVPALLDFVDEWLDDFDSECDTAWGPVHAWRVLGQLRAAEAVEPLLAMVVELDEMDDDWYLEEFPEVWGMIGEPAIEPLSRFLADAEMPEFPRCSTMHGLRETALRYPELRSRVVEILTAELATERPEESGEFKGFLICDLLELKAVEAGETIERAFAANVVDPTIVGHWGDVRKKLGIPGLGLAPDHSPGWPTIADRMGYPADDDPGFWTNPEEPELSPEEVKRRQQAELKKKRAAAVKAKKKKKKERKNRKNGRKPR